jgi:hypothetical protein
MGEPYEGTLVAIQNLHRTSGTWPLADSSGQLLMTDNVGLDTIVVFIDCETDIDGSPEPQWPMDVVGVVSQFDPEPPYTSGYQLLPRNLGDFLPAGSTGVGGNDGSPPSSAVLALAPNTPNPFSTSTLIAYNLPRSGEYTLTIYNISGQVVRNLLKVSGRVGPGVVRWDGRSETGSRLAGGVYLSCLEGPEGKVVRSLVLVR